MSSWCLWNGKFYLCWKLQSLRRSLTTLSFYVEILLNPRWCKLFSSSPLSCTNPEASGRKCGVKDARKLHRKTHKMVDQQQRGVTFPFSPGEFETVYCDDNPIRVCDLYKCVNRLAFLPRFNFLRDNQSEGCWGRKGTEPARCCAAYYDLSADFQMDDRGEKNYELTHLCP